MSRITLPGGRPTAALATGALALVLAACGSGAGGHSTMPGMSHHAEPGASAGPGTSHDDMHAMVTGDGLTAEKDGYRLKPATTRLPASGKAAYRFSVTGPNGKPVTHFNVDQSERLHFYVVRTDLTGFRHLHPTMAADGTWTAALADLDPGTWRLFASFTPDTGPGKGRDYALSTTAHVPGAAHLRALPKASRTATVDGYTVTVRGDLMADMAHPLTVNVSKDGKPVSDLQPYLGAYAHLTAFHAGDQAFAHFHPEGAAGGGHGGPDLTFHAALPRSGDWRLFVQFRAADKLHTAALTLHAG